MTTNLAENNLIRFVSISKKKEAMVVKFKAKGIRGGMNYTASFSVDLSSAEVDAADSLEKIIEECARIAIKEFKKTDFQFEGLMAI